MRKRGEFLVGVTLIGASVWIAGHSLAAVTQNPVEPVDATQHSQQRPRPGQEPQADGPTLPNPEKKVLEDNDKDMKKKVDRLFELATELKAEVDKTDSSKVLSVNLLKKAEEIEKLAREIKNRSKG
jgi:hypothetical protein